jgi:plastocyanin
MRRWSRTRGTLMLWAALAIALAGCGPSLDEVAPATGVSTVAVRDNTFAPRVIEVAAGTEVTWDWIEARRAHNVIGDGFASDVLAEGEFRHTFDSPGTFEYLCSLHGGMRGRVIVTE